MSVLDSGFHKIARLTGAPKVVSAPSAVRPLTTPSVFYLGGDPIHFSTVKRGLRDLAQATYCPNTAPILSYYGDSQLTPSGRALSAIVLHVTNENLEEMAGHYESFQSFNAALLVYHSPSKGQMTQAFGFLQGNGRLAFVEQPDPSAVKLSLRSFFGK